jgi:hypothetical protein
MFKHQQNLKSTTSAMVVLLVAWMPMGAQAQADATGAGFHRGNSKWVMKPAESDNKPKPAGFLSLMQNVRMASSGPPLDKEVVQFGPYTNDSEYPVTLTFTSVGGHKNKFVNFYVNNVMVTSVSDGSVLTYTVPAKVTYGWHLKNDRTISGSVATASLTPDEIRKINLPSVQEFTTPRPLGAYKGCVEYWWSGWLGDGDSSTPYWSQQPDRTAYYYAESRWSDGSFEVHRNQALQLFGLESWGAVIEGPGVVAGRCIVSGKVDAPPPRQLQP